jgi:glycosyltransferase involved in cell wall biosynthesis
VISNTGPSVLVIARTHPNNVLPTLGIWTQRLVQASADVSRPTVVAPVPYAPPGLPVEDYARYRRVLRERNEHGVAVHHPRVPVGPGSLLFSFEADLFYPFVRRLCDRLHGERTFDLIHAHFIYPDGVIAARLGRRYGIPVVTTEHAIWQPLSVRFPRVHGQVMEALESIGRVTVVSEAVRASVIATAGERVATDLLPNVVDEDTFRLPTSDEAWDPDQILFVGVVRRVKGLDVLVRAMDLLRRRRPRLRLKVLGAPFYRGYQRDEREVRDLIHELRLGRRIEFMGQATPAEVASAMRDSAALVLPSRREAFPTVLLEALASGTPVVATRCGGPEEVVTDAVGRLVPPEDPNALAQAIDEIVAQRSSFSSIGLRNHVVSCFGKAATAERIEQIYRGVLMGGRTGAAQAE